MPGQRDKAVRVDQMDPAAKSPSRSLHEVHNVCQTALAVFPLGGFLVPVVVPLAVLLSLTLAAVLSPNMVFHSGALRRARLQSCSRTFVDLVAVNLAGQGV